MELALSLCKVMNNTSLGKHPMVGWFSVSLQHHHKLLRFPLDMTCPQVIGSVAMAVFHSLDTLDHKPGSLAWPPDTWLSDHV